MGATPPHPQRVFMQQRRTTAGSVSNSGALLPLLEICNTSRLGQTSGATQRCLKPGSARELGIRDAQAGWALQKQHLRKYAPRSPDNLRRVARRARYRIPPLSPVVRSCGLPSSTQVIGGVKHRLLTLEDDAKASCAFSECLLTAL